MAKKKFRQGKSKVNQLDVGNEIDQYSNSGSYNPLTRLKKKKKKRKRKVKTLLEKTR